MNFKSMLVVAALAGAASQANATGLTFDFTPALGNGAAMPQDYGDRVIGPAMVGTAGLYSYSTAGGFTPNVVVDYTGGTQTFLNFWSTGFDDLVNVVENELDFDSQLKISFTADASFAARLDSFDIGNFGSAITIPNIRVTDGLGNVLYSNPNYALGASDATHQSISFVGGISASQLNLIIDLTGLGGNSDNVGLDNLQFGQTAAVPEPSSYALMLAGLGFVGFVAARRRRAGAAA